MLEYKCHCRACQRASGSGFVPLLWIPIDKLELTASRRQVTILNDGDGALRIGG
jgi:hypothetical protein